MHRQKSLRGSLAVAALVVLVATSFLPIQADTYQFIISGDPIAAATMGTCATASAATALETATRSSGSAASQIEARYRTWDESDGIALRSDKYVATIIIIM